MRVPDLFEPVVGFRVFLLAETEPALRGRYSRTAWDVGTTEARCLPESFPWAQYTLPTSHEAPAKECRCGLHAYYDLPSLDGELVSSIIGLVSCWGKIVPHPRAFRAQYGRVHALWDAFDRKSTARVAERYSVPTFSSLKDLVALAPEVGAPLAPGLRGFGPARLSFPSLADYRAMELDT